MTVRPRTNHGLPQASHGLPDEEGLAGPDALAHITEFWKYALESPARPELVEGSFRGKMVRQAHHERFGKEDYKNRALISRNAIV